MFAEGFYLSERKLQPVSAVNAARNGRGIHFDRFQIIPLPVHGQHFKPLVGTWLWRGDQIKAMTPSQWETLPSPRSLFAAFAQTCFVI